MYFYNAVFIWLYGSLTQMSMYRILIVHANLNPFEFYLIHPTSVDLSTEDITEHDFLLL